MSEPLKYAVSTTLPQHRVWQLFTNIENWPRFCSLYRNLHWVGEPWAPGSAIAGELLSPLHLPLRYLIKRYQPVEVVIYLAHSASCGFATERTILFKPLPFGTLIRVESYGVGTPPALPGGIDGFLGAVNVGCFANFALFCDEEQRVLGRVRSRRQATAGAVAHQQTGRARSM